MTILDNTSEQDKAGSLLRADLAAVAERFATARDRAQRAANVHDRNDAWDESLDASGAFHAASLDLADLLLLLLRYAIRHRRNELLLYVAEATKPAHDPEVCSLHEDLCPGCRPGMSDEELRRLLVALERRPDALRALRRLLSPTAKESRR